MPILDSILPPNLHPVARHSLNFLVIFHIIAFAVYLYVLIRDYIRARKLNAIDDLIEEEETKGDGKKSKGDKRHTKKKGPKQE